MQLEVTAEVATATDSEDEEKESQQDILCHVQLPTLFQDSYNELIRIRATIHRTFRCHHPTAAAAAARSAPLRWPLLPVLG